MKIGLLGACGFLGSSLARRFAARDDKVRIFNYRPARRDAFLAEFEAYLKEEKPDAVVNAGASQNGKDTPAALSELLDSNVFLPAVMASMIRDKSLETCLVGFGTSWQTGEKGEDSPFNAYAASKAAREDFMNHFALDGVRCASLRLYDTYGPQDTRNKIINLIADALIQKSELAMSAGEQSIDLVYIDDVMDAVDAVVSQLRAARQGMHAVYAVRSGKPTTILELLEIMKNEAGLENGDFIKTGVYSYRKRERFSLFTETPTPPGWLPKVSLEEGIRRVLADRGNRVLKLRGGFLVPQES